MAVNYETGTSRYDAHFGMPHMTGIRCLHPVIMMRWIDVVPVRSTTLGSCMWQCRSKKQGISAKISTSSFEEFDILNLEVL
jgi:hypothetical protein